MIDIKNNRQLHQHLQPVVISYERSKWKITHVTLWNKVRKSLIKCSINTGRCYTLLALLLSHIALYVCIYRVSQEERARLRKSVPYVKLYGYNPKHLYPKLNDYGDNGHRKVWASGVSTYCTPSVTPYSSTAHARQRDIVMQWPWRMLYSTVALTSQDNSQLRPV